MTKKRRTKKQKIIARLRRQLKQKNTARQQKQGRSGDKKKISRKIIKTSKEAKKKAFLSYEPRLIKRDLMKTILLSLIFLAFILILKFSHLVELLFH